MKNAAHQKTTVVIVGAGPTGLSLAAQFIRQNIDFILLDKKEGATSLSKAIVVQARTLEIFKELGIAEEAVKRGQLTTGMQLFYKGMQRVVIDLADLGKGISEFTFALSLEQSKTEQLLVDYLFQQGKKVHWKCEFSHFEQHHDGVTAYYKDGHGQQRKLHASYLVGCDGAGSLVRHQLNLSFEGSTEPKLFYVADVVLSSPVINSNVLYMHMIKKGFVLFFPMEGKGHYRIVGIVPEHKEGNAEYVFSDIAPLIQQQIFTLIHFDEMRWFSTYKVHSRKASAFMKDRCFIAGDAAHIHTPAGGQGMNTGIQDAYNLAWKMAYVLRGEANGAILKTYDAERSANAKHLLQSTDRMFDIMSGVNRFWNFMRLNLFPPFLSLLSKNDAVKKRIFPLLSQTGIAYPDSMLNIKSSVGKVKAGDRMHYFVFANGKDIFTYLAQPYFKLLYFGSDTHKEEHIHVKIKIIFHSFTEIPAPLFGNARGFYILLRPDNHISYIGKDFSKCRELFKRFV